jgi:hypothetical protein
MSPVPLQLALYESDRPRDPGVTAALPKGIKEYPWSEDDLSTVSKQNHCRRYNHSGCAIYVQANWALVSHT